MSTWSKELPFPITVCNENGVILEMNDKSIELFEQDGGAGLIGKQLQDCHPEPSKTKLFEMLKSHLPNTYLSIADGCVSLNHESPWFEDGIFKGFVEFNIPLPADISNKFNRE